MKLMLLICAIALSFQFSNAQTISIVRLSDRKIIELKKIITISPTQENAIRAAYEQYSNQNDSVLFHVQDPIVAATLNRKSEKYFNNTFMNTLTQQQQNVYILITYTPEVTERAAVKVAFLKQTGNYTKIQLDSAQADIFNYLMLEKVAYKRNEYDYVKQNENIAQLKKLQPTRLKKANAQEILKIEGKVNTRGYKW